MESKSSLPYSQGLTNGPYSESDEFSPHFLENFSQKKCDIDGLIFAADFEAASTPM
jgi:hypothetical protein